MAKAKQFIGESYTDSLGQQWRWDGKKYIRNYGASPMASIKRSVDQKIVPLANQAKQALTNKGPIEGRGRKRNPTDKAINIFSNLIENPSISDQIKYPLEIASLAMQNAFELANDDDSTLTWVKTMQLMEDQKIQEAQKTETEDLLNNTENQKEPQDVNLEPELQQDQYRESTFEKDEETTSKIGKIGDENWEVDEKRNFLEDTANSPAAQAGLDDDLRWQARKRYEDFLKKREVKSSLGKAR